MTGFMLWGTPSHRQPSSRAAGGPPHRQCFRLLQRSDRQGQEHRGCVRLARGQRSRSSELFAADQGAKTAASISIDLPQLDFYYDGFKTAAAGRGLDWVSKQTYPATATDFSTRKPGACAVEESGCGHQRLAAGGSRAS